ncbi:unnamed protein product [Arabidopsis arenosa]|uniref:Retrotransposon gag domain-containing protein n=1 Tax=Arabidopsis arenosa TaxID=38785 RepID=A0A8S2A8S5_ARAAE|nr:unnamed protein product [Arabidopsis arenosa]
MMDDFDESVDRHQLGVDRHHMGNRPMTFADYNIPDPFYSNRSAIRPPPPESADFLFKPWYYDLVSNNQFDGLEGQLPFDHIEKFEDIVSSIKAEGVQPDYLLCKLFPYSLGERGNSWLRQLRPGSLTTWQEVKDTFLIHFYDESMSEEVRLQISSFSQGPTESFKTAWALIIVTKSYSMEQAMEISPQGHPAKQQVLLRILLPAMASEALITREDSSPLQAAPAIQEGPVSEETVGSESDEETVEIIHRQVVPLKPGNAKDLDIKCQTHVDPIILPKAVLDAAQDISWSDDEVDPRVDTVVNLANQRFKFNNDMFPGSCTPSEVVVAPKKQKRSAIWKGGRVRKSSKQGRIPKNPTGLRKTHQSPPNEEDAAVSFDMNALSRMLDAKFVAQYKKIIKGVADWFLSNTLIYVENGKEVPAENGKEGHCPEHGLSLNSSVYGIAAFYNGIFPGDSSGSRAADVQANHVDEESSKEGSQEFANDGIYGNWNSSNQPLETSPSHVGVNNIDVNVEDNGTPDNANLECSQTLINANSEVGVTLNPAEVSKDGSIPEGGDEIRDGKDNLPGGDEIRDADDNLPETQQEVESEFASAVSSEDLESQEVVHKENKPIQDSPSKGVSQMAIDPPQDSPSPVVAPISITKSTKVLVPEKADVPSQSSVVGNPGRRRSKRLKTISSKLDGRYQFDKKTKLLVGHPSPIANLSSGSLDPEDCFNYSMNKLKALISTSLVGDVTIAIKDVLELIERKKPMANKVMDALLKFSRHILRTDDVDGEKLRVDFPIALIDVVSGVGQLDRAELFIEMTVLACNVHLRTDASLKTDLEPVSRMLPILMRTSSHHQERRMEKTPTNRPRTPERTNMSIPKTYVQTMDYGDEGSEEEFNISEIDWGEDSSHYSWEGGDDYETEPWCEETDSEISLEEKEDEQEEVTSGNEADHYMESYQDDNSWRHKDDSPINPEERIHEYEAEQEEFNDEESLVEPYERDKPWCDETGSQISLGEAKQYGEETWHHEAEESEDEAEEDDSWKHSTDNEGDITEEEEAVSEAGRDDDYEP